MGGRQKFLYRYNWSHDHPKRSYRFDSGSFPAYANAFGEMSHNVAWNTPGGFAIKGDDHLIHNNLLVGEGTLELFNMKRWASKNERTLVANNVVPGFSTGFHDWNKPVQKKSQKKIKLLLKTPFGSKKRQPLKNNGMRHLSTTRESLTTEPQPWSSSTIACCVTLITWVTRNVLRDPKEFRFSPESKVRNSEFRLQHSSNGCSMALWCIYGFREAYWRTWCRALRIWRNTLLDLI